MTPFDLLTLSLAATRLLFLWFNAELFRPVRALIAKLGRWPAYLTNCAICLSVWLGGLTTLAYLDPWAYWGLVALAVSALVGPLHGILMWLETLHLRGGPAGSLDTNRVEALEATVASLRDAVKGRG